jgi:hypothetical protein
VTYLEVQIGEGKVIQDGAIVGEPHERHYIL